MSRKERSVLISWECFHEFCWIAGTVCNLLIRMVGPVGLEPTTKGL